jgi:hypothetical protein
MSSAEIEPIAMCSAVQPSYLYATREKLTFTGLNPSSYYTIGPSPSVSEHGKASGLDTLLGHA